MLIEYKLLNKKNTNLVEDIEINLPLNEIALKSKELSADYELELKTHNILNQSFKDIFANDIFTEHDEFFQKIIIYSLTIENLRVNYLDNIEYIVIYERNTKIAKYLNEVYKLKILAKIPNSRNLFQTEIKSEKIDEIKGIFYTFKTLVSKIKINLLRRIALIKSLYNLNYGSQAILHHTNRFQGLISDINHLELGHIESINCISDINTSRQVLVFLMALIITTLSAVIASISMMFIKNIHYPKLAKQFISDKEITSSDILKRIESSIFYVIVFMFAFKIKNLERVFIYSHLDVMSRCFMRCATISNIDISYIRNNFLYFSTELHCMNYTNFYVRSEEELNIGHQTYLLNIKLLGSKRHDYNSNRHIGLDVLYIDEANTIDAKEPELRRKIYNDLIELSNNLNIKIKIRPHPTDLTYNSRYPALLQIENEVEIDRSIERHSIIIGRSSSLLLTLANLGKTVIIYDPGMSLWYVFQSKLESFQNISFVSEFKELKKLLDCYPLD